MHAKRPLTFLVPILSLAATRGVDGQSCAPWVDQTPPPGNRRSAALVYHESRGETVLFGGRADGAFSHSLGDTWVWNGAAWDRRDVAGPPLGGATLAVYDAARHLVLVLRNNDVWEWDGVGWSVRAASSGPFPRAASAVVYDRGRNVILLFGGSVDCNSMPCTPFGDTWQWDGTNWSLLADVGPPTRSGHALAYDESRGRVVLFGGRDAQGANLQDTWEWDGLRWARGADGLAPRSYHQMTYDAGRHVTVLFGGWGIAQARDTWEWDGTRWTRRSTQGPERRTWHAMTYDRARGVTVLFGGSTDRAGTLGDVWEWDGQIWQQRSGGSPPARSDAAMAFDDDRGVATLFSGLGTATHFDTWEWDGSQWRLRSILGDITSGNGLVYDSRRKVMVLAGSHLPSVLEWDGESWLVRTVLSPGPSYHYEHAMVYDKERGKTLLFGGQSSNQALNDMWEWDGLVWQPRTEPGPSRRARHAMAYDDRRKVAVLFGGLDNSGNRLGDTWEWDGTGWREIVAVGPEPRCGHAMAFDRDAGLVVLMGGQAQDRRTLADTWSWDGDEWSVRTPLDPALARHEHSMVYDSHRGMFLAYGGQSGEAAESYRSDTLTLSTCAFDADGDEVPDLLDACNHSDRRGTVEIGTCLTDVHNQLLADGCTMMDRINECAASAEDHRAFIPCVRELTRQWRQEGLMSVQEQAQIRRCAVKADVP